MLLPSPTTDGEGHAHKARTHDRVRKIHFLLGESDSGKAPKADNKPTNVYVEVLATHPHPTLFFPKREIRGGAGNTFERARDGDRDIQYIQ